MYCKKCGANLPEGIKFCTSCGAEVIEEAANYNETTLLFSDVNTNQTFSQTQYSDPTPANEYCKKCGAVLTPGNKFCMSCGAEVNESSNAYYENSQSVNNNYQTDNYYQSYSTPQPDNSKSVLIWGILSLVFASTFYLSFLGIIFSIVAKSKAKALRELNGMSRTGSKLATAGLILGIILTAILLLVIIIAIIGAATASRSYYYY